MTELMRPAREACAVAGRDRADISRKTNPLSNFLIAMYE
jgi:hypothetical protein